MRVPCHVYDDEVEGDYTPFVEGVLVVCSRCQHEEQAMGRSEWSVRAALTKLRAGCPKKEANYYVDAEADEVDTSTHVKGPIQPT